VADASPVPVVLYSMPANTGVDLSVDLVAGLASHANVAGLKDSGGDVAKLAAVVHRTRHLPDFQVLAGSASFLLPAYVAGCVGGVCALANVLGDELCRLHSQYHEAGVVDADLQRRLVAPNAAVTKRFGVAGLKAALDLFNFYGGPPRLPLLPLDEANRRAVEAAFVSNGFAPSKSQ